MFNLFRKAKAAIPRKAKYVFLVELADDIKEVTTRRMMRIEANSAEDAKRRAMIEVMRRSGIALGDKDVVSVTGGTRRA